MDQVIIEKISQTFLDGFGNIRVSQPYTLFDCKQTSPGQQVFWDDQETTATETVVLNGTDTSSTWSINRASTTIGVKANVNKKRIRQTLQRFNYQPGKSNLWLCTAVVGTTPSGITKRLGQFDKDNGYFWQFDSNGIGVGIRSKVSGSPVDRIVYQQNWNTDKCDEVDYPYATFCDRKLDQTKSLIYGCFYEWLGVGSVWFFVVIDGEIIVVHKFNHSNILDSVYTSTPVLPIRYEIANDGTGVASTLETVCCCVISQGGQERTGLARGINRSTGLTVASSANWYPLISVRVNPIYKAVDVRPVKLSVICASTASFAVGMFVNPGVAGVDAVNWQTLPSSSLQYDFSRTTSNYLVETVASCLFGQYAVDKADAINGFSDAFWSIGTDLSGNSDELVLAVKTISGNSETYYGSISFVEST